MPAKSQTIYWDIVKKTLRLFGMSQTEAETAIREERKRLHDVLSPEMQDMIYHDDPFKVAVRLDGGESPQAYTQHISAYRNLLQSAQQKSSKSPSIAVSRRVVERPLSNRLAHRNRLNNRAKKLKRRNS